MRGYLSADIRDEIRRRVDLVELASAHVSLKKAGRHYKGLCPFHQEKTPSFHVDRERGLWHCFGCSRGGDIFDFVMEIGHLSFAEAVETLARRAGVRLERTPEERRQATERDRLFRALEAAAGFFTEQLRHPERGRAAREYLGRRGVDDATADRFRLGYAPPEWDGLLRALGARGYDAALLAAGGLVVPRERGDGYFDMFRHRLMFPILDLQDRPVAFGGRALDDAQPKYLNSRETAVFSKGRTVYALNWAREDIRRKDEVLVVEGNMDVLTCHQFGFRHAVATLGTALTADQVAVLRRFASRAVLVYDADAAGRAAMERAHSVFEEADMPVRVVVLPSGDPDEFLRTAGPEKFAALLETAVPIFDYQVAQAASRHDLQTIEGRVRLVDDLLPSLAAVRHPIRQAEYIRSLAQRFGLAEDAIRQRLKVRRAGGATAGEVLEAPPPERARHQAERLLVHLMVHDPQVREQVGAALGPGEFRDPGHRALAEVLLAAGAAGAETLIDRLGDGEAQRLLVQLVFEPPPVVEREAARVVRDAIDYIVRREPAARARQELARRIHQAQAAGDVEQVRRLQLEYVKLVSPSPSGPSGGEDAAGRTLPERG
ncbi:MAG: DNA primase [Armatimonadota bacterium]|nr:DNA primase [Armatimonadota bacterium]MDR7402109.1 DNA primase [Armatimonadota bacterium]MDR7404927.1 DNA primase [Armatimonadota bacterium]MDR7437677.1 DNA primase [Armatimonadota bacterium]MDR7472410.1 DNA primase [Armatimonadota bacterium]